MSARPILNEAVFEEDQRPPLMEADGQLVLDLDGFEGPIDVLLALARSQKVDLTRISILALADQFLAFVAAARRYRLELAADYLVMAAWLAYLKSRLLLPEPADPNQPSAVELAAALAFQLQRLEAMQNAGAKLMTRPQLGFDIFARGAPEMLAAEIIPSYQASLYDVLSAYGDVARRTQKPSLEIPVSELASIEEAIERLGAMLGRLPEWTDLAAFMPSASVSTLARRSAMAALLVASLELVKTGRAEINQNEAFGPLMLRAARNGA